MLNHAFLSVLSRAQASARREEGQALVEYALILFLIAMWMFLFPLLGMDVDIRIGG